MIIKLTMQEHNSPYPEAYESEAIIDVNTDKLKQPEVIFKALQKAYDEYFATLDYESEEEAMDDGICFGSCFNSIPYEITKKYGFKILQVEEYITDYDYGFKK